MKNMKIYYDENSTVIEAIKVLASKNNTTLSKQVMAMLTDCINAGINSNVNIRYFNNKYLAEKFKEKNITEITRHNLYRLVSGKLSIDDLNKTLRWLEYDNVVRLEDLKYGGQMIYVLKGDE
jgi:hypothetical protein